MLAELREALEHNGFTAAEAERIIIPVPQGTLPLGVQPQTLKLMPSEIDAAVAQVQVDALAGKVRIDAATGEITIVVPLDHDDTEKLKSCVKTPEAKVQVEEAVALVREAEKAFGGQWNNTRPLALRTATGFSRAAALCSRKWNAVRVREHLFDRTPLEAQRERCFAVSRL